jgi:membrane protease YdiL (CAAX protease family)
VSSTPPALLTAPNPQPGSAPKPGAFPAREFAVPLVILFVVAVAELVTAAFDARSGLAAHCVILAGLVVLGARSRDAAARELYWSLTLAPTIRIGSLSLPLGHLPLVQWYPLIGIPIFTAALVTARRLGYTWGQLGLRLDVTDLGRQLAFAPIGVFLGVAEYLIFQPAPLVEHFTVEDIWLPALVLVVFTGLEEELIFRGLMQRAALRSLGRWGLVYVSGVFAVLHIGYLSILDVVFVFLVGLLFAVFVLRTRSLLGVTLAHGLTNIGLFLVLPFLAPIFLGSGTAELLPLPAPPTPR